MAKSRGIAVFELMFVFNPRGPLPLQEPPPSSRIFPIPLRRKCFVSPIQSRSWAEPRQVSGKLTHDHAALLKVVPARWKVCRRAHRQSNLENLGLRCDKYTVTKIRISRQRTEG